MVADMNDVPEPPDVPVGQYLALPIYNSDQIAERPDARLFIVSGITAARAAQSYFPKYVVLCGPLRADWSVVRGRIVEVWADGGVEGDQHARNLAAAVQPYASKVILNTCVDKEEGWTLADASKDGWTTTQVVQFADRDSKKYRIRMKHSTEVAVVETGPVEAMPAEFVLHRDKQGKPYPTEHNAKQLIITNPDYASRIWFDQFGERLMLDRKRWRKIDTLRAKTWLQMMWEMHYITEAAVHNSAELIADANPRHELKDYLGALQWDGTERLAGWLTYVYSAERTNYTEAVGRCWMVSAVARIYEPGCKADCMLVLEGGQGAKKTTSLKVLGGDYYGEAHQNPVTHRKDFLDELQGYWIIEIPEMHILAGERHGVEKLKGMLSTPEDNYRKSYGREAEPHKRQCIFAGTTNLNEWNTDQTGGRRFWPIQCGEIDTDYLATWRDQLWAEAVALYKAGGKWWDIPYADAMAEQEMRRQADAWESVVSRYVTESPHLSERGRIEYWTPREKPLEFLLIDDLLQNGVGRALGSISKADQMRMSSILGGLGYRRRRPTINGERTYAYYPTIPVTVTPALPAPLARVIADDDDVPY